MKSIKYIMCLSILSSTLLQSQVEYRFFINNINMPINNIGVLADVYTPPDGSLGRYDGIGFLFSGGFYISGYNGDSLWASGMATATLVRDYQPGIVGSDPDLPENKIYVVSVDDPPFSQSWQDWRDAVALGADFYDGDGDGIYDPVDKNGNGVWDANEDKPDILGDLTAWCVYNDGVPAAQRRWKSEPQGIEIQQTVFAYKDTHPLFSNTENTIFIRYRIINKGSTVEKLDSVYFTLYSDFDIGVLFHNDLAGSDTLLFGSYGYKTGPDTAFGNNPPSIFHHFNQFPHVYIPGETFIDNNNNGIYDPGIDTPVDTAYNHRGPVLRIRKIPGAKNQGFSSSTFLLRAFSLDLMEPGNIYQARNYARGLSHKGNVIDPCTFPFAQVFGNINCAEVNPFYWVSGDPVTNSGWISTQAWDMRTLCSTGPFNLVQNDFYDIITAYTLGQGVDHINSVSIARQNVVNAIEAYLTNFGQQPDSIEEIIIKDFQLFQNFPNPFNPGTMIRFEIPEAGFISLKVYDILGKEVATLVNEEKSAGSYDVEFNTQLTTHDKQLASGIYFYQLKAGKYITTKKMILTK